MHLLSGSQKCQQKTCKLNYVIMLCCMQVRHMYLYVVFVNIYGEGKHKITHKKQFHEKEQMEVGDLLL